MIDGSASILWRSVLAYVLNAPVAELSMSDNVNARQDFIDARALINAV